MKNNRTSAQLALNFTKEEGITIQCDHLNEWKTVLTEKAFIMLEALVIKDNMDAQDGFDIVRGNAIDLILYNEVIKNLQSA